MLGFPRAHVATPLLVRLPGSKVLKRADGGRAWSLPAQSPSVHMSIRAALVSIVVDDVDERPTHPSVTAARMDEARMPGPSVRAGQSGRRAIASDGSMYELPSVCERTVGSVKGRRPRRALPR